MEIIIQYKEFGFSVVFDEKLLGISTEDLERTRNLLKVLLTIALEAYVEYFVLMARSGPLMGGYAAIQTACMQKLVDRVGDNIDRLNLGEDMGKLLEEMMSELNLSDSQIETAFKSFGESFDRNSGRSKTDD